MIKSVLFSDCAAFLQKHDIRQGAIMNIGIDNLREINAIHGMQMGDEILDLFTQIIVGEVGEKNVFRLESSDEFIVILPKYHVAAEGKNLFVKIQKEVNEQCHKRSFYYTVSVCRPRMNRSADVPELLRDYAASYLLRACYTLHPLGCTAA